MGQDLLIETILKLLDRTNLTHGNCRFRDLLDDAVIVLAVLFVPGYSRVEQDILTDLTALYDLLSRLYDAQREALLTLHRPLLCTSNLLFLLYSPNEALQFLGMLLDSFIFCLQYSKLFLQACGVELPQRF